VKQEMNRTFIVANLKDAENQPMQNHVQRKKRCKRTICNNGSCLWLHFEFLSSKSECGCERVSQRKPVGAIRLVPNDIEIDKVTHKNLHIKE